MLGKRPGRTQAYSIHNKKEYHKFSKHSCGHCCFPIDNFHVVFYYVEDYCLTGCNWYAYQQQWSQLCQSRGIIGRLRTYQTFDVTFLVIGSFLFAGPTGVTIIDSDPVEAAKVLKDFSYVSTAGGAFLEWLEGKVLPGIEPIS